MTLLKFYRVLDLGTIIVPNDQSNGGCIGRFLKRSGAKVNHFNKEITDQNFPKVSCPVNPGDEFKVWVFAQAVRNTTTEERVEYLEAMDCVDQEGKEVEIDYGQRPVYLGAQGVLFVFDQKRDELPKSFWYISQDKEKNLYRNGFDAQLPFIFPFDTGEFDIGLIDYRHVWFNFYLFFGFYKIE